MTFRLFIDILLRSMLLNVWLFLLLFSISLPLNNDIFFFNSEHTHNLVILAMLLLNNILHWCMEIICLFKKPKPDEDLE